MNRNLLTFLVLAVATLAWTGPARADNYSETIKLFQDAGESKAFFGKSYGYAVFPTIGKGGIGIGGAYGKGRVYVGGAAVGETSMAQVSYGFQLGGQGYSMIIFFEDKRAFDEFTQDGFEFGAQASAVAATKGASADTSYDKGVAVFTNASGGLMVEGSVGGQKFTYEPIR